MEFITDGKCTGMHYFTEFYPPKNVYNKLFDMKFIGILIPAYPVPNDYNMPDYHHEDILDIIISSKSIDSDLAYARYNNTHKSYTFFDIPVPVVMLDIPENEFKILIVSQKEISQIEWVYEYSPFSYKDDDIHTVITQLNCYKDSNKLNQITFSKGKKIFEITQQDV